MKTIRDIVVITNNKWVCDRFNNIVDVHFIEGGYIDVLHFVRDEIHKGKTLVSHPLMGSVKPNETPYRSVLIGKSINTLDFNSLFVIEDSIERYRTFIKNKPLPSWSEKQLKDFEIIDFKLIESALESLNIKITT